MVFPLPYQLALSQVNALKLSCGSRLITAVCCSGFAVVFAEDVSEVQSTDAVSGESICFFQCVGGDNKFYSSCLE